MVGFPKPNPFMAQKFFSLRTRFVKNWVGHAIRQAYRMSCFMVGCVYFFSSSLDPFDVMCIPHEGGLRPPGGMTLFWFWERSLRLSPGGGRKGAETHPIPPVPCKPVGLGFTTFGGKLSCPGVCSGFITTVVIGTLGIQPQPLQSPEWGPGNTPGVLQWFRGIFILAQNAPGW
ncbi:MAG: hypothetical protein CM15mP120_06050 [Pseudomonadota bacterium]|nr:MAG: hypothetical protein CM15mP120_06050 [Pseudomonadota bacterium]